MAPPLSRRAWLQRAGLGMLAGSLLPGTLLGEEPEPPYDTLVNLGGNENPLGPSPAVLRAILTAAPFSARYPFREEERLREEIAAHEQVPLDHVVLGHGADDLLAMAAQLCLRPGTAMVCAEPTYFQLPDYARKLGALVRTVPHHPETRCHDLAALAEAVDASTTLAYVCNPDNPTGTVCPAAEVTAFCQRVAPQCPVVLDEVYLEWCDDFASATQVPLVRAGLPVILVRSFSKVYGLAGHRIGYALAPPPLARQLASWQRSGLNFIGVAAARAALRDRAFVASCRRRLSVERERFGAVLDSLGLRYQASVGNFLFHEVQRPLADFQAALRRRGFLVGWPHPAPAAYPNWCRTSLGTESEMNRFYAALRAECATPH